jgi:hypothetical protein
MNRQFEKCRVVSSAAMSSDAASISHLSNLNLGAQQRNFEEAPSASHLLSSTTKSTVSSKNLKEKQKIKSKEEEKRPIQTPKKSCTS